MDIFAVDTSVTVKWFYPQKESLVKEAIQILNDHLDGKIHLITSDFLLLELANALIIGKGMTPPLVKRCLSAIVNCQMSIVSVDKNLIGESIVLAGEQGLTSYDAVFLALAKVNSCRLISADEKGHGKITDGSVLMLKDYPKI